MTSPGPDLLLRGGRVIDPSQGLDAPRDVLVRAGRIAALLEAGAPVSDRPAPETIDATGSLVTPGLIDLHGHWFEASPFGIHSAVNLRGGVTTAIDLGSAGYGNFFAFRRHGIDDAPVRVLAFVHIAAAGLATSILPELGDIRYARPVEAAETVVQNRDVAIGIKVRTGFPCGPHTREALEAAIEAAERVGPDTPVVAHVGGETPMAYVCSRLRPGDTVTHCFTPGSGGLLGPDGGGRLLPEVVDARRRGVRFDIGHGCGSFSWAHARRALDEGFPPDSISTDLHRYSVIGTARDLPTTMTKLLHLGMSLGEVLAAVTTGPAVSIRREDTLGTLRVGGPADLAVLRLVDEPTELVDSQGLVEVATTRLQADWTIVGGRPTAADSVEVDLRPFVSADAEVDCGTPPTGLA